jgi:hypothetical protein
MEEREKDAPPMQPLIKKKKMFVAKSEGNSNKNKIICLLRGIKRESLALVQLF